MHKQNVMRLLTAALCLLLILTGCNQAEVPADSPYADGTYTGKGMGYGGELTVEVHIEKGVIGAIQVLDNGETAAIAAPAIEQLPPAIIVAQSTEVEAIAGATMTSQGIIAAVQHALDQAMGIEAEDAERTIMQNPDVIIVGGGPAGMRAAIAAADNGARVQLFEKTARLGGTFGGGTLSGTGTKMQIEAGILDDTPEKFFADFVRLNENYQRLNPGVVYSWNEDLGRYYAEHSGRAVDWLDENGADLGDRQPSQPTLYEPLNTPRVYSGNRQSYDEVLKKVLQPHLDSGMVNVTLESPVADLITSDGAVVGVITSDGTEVYAKSTILATGGYGHSEELVTRFNFEVFTTTVPEAISGDGFIMAEKAGAYLRNMDFLTAYAGGLKTPEDGLTNRLSIRVKDFPYIIFVNEAGQRFVDEMGPEDGSAYDEITSWWKKGAVYIMLDQAMIDELKAEGISVISRDPDWKEFDDQLAKGNVLFSGETIAEVAEKAGIDPAGLEATIERYNSFAAAGYDDDFGRDRLMKAFTGGTYYIFETTPYIMITAGGPDMNDRGEVLTEAGEPIPGLYQAGEIVGMANAYGRTTIGGTGNTGTIVWGELAGNSAAAYALS